LIALIESGLTWVASRIFRGRPWFWFIVDLGGSVRAEPAHASHLLELVRLDENVIRDLHWATLVVANYGRIGFENLTFEVTLESSSSTIVAVISDGVNACICFNDDRKVGISVPFFATSERIRLGIYYRGASSVPCVHCGINGILVEYAPRGFLGLAVPNSGECRVMVN
jgi:hypothetical protein